MIDPVENPTGQQEIGHSEQIKFVNTVRQLMSNPNGKGSVIPKITPEDNNAEISYQKKGYKVDVFAQEGSLLETDLTVPGAYRISITHPPVAIDEDYKEVKEADYWLVVENDGKKTLKYIELKEIYDKDDRILPDPLKQKIDAAIEEGNFKKATEISQELPHAAGERRKLAEDTGEETFTYDRYTEFNRLLQNLDLSPADQVDPDQDYFGNEEL